MNSFFDGKLWIKSLIVTDQPAARTEVRARLQFPNGELAVLGDGENVVRHLSYVELKQGMGRGNHFHKLRHEYFYLITGEVDVIAEQLSNKERANTVIRGGDLVFINPEIAHVFIPRVAGHAIEYAAEQFDPGDVYRYPL